MSSAPSWVLVSTDRWHAWGVGSYQTVCGKVSTRDLSKRPAKAIADAPPEGAVVCLLCERAIGSTNIPCSTKKPLGGVAGVWLGLLRKHLLHVRARVAEPTLRELATRLSMIGAPGDPSTVVIYDQIRALLLTPRYQRRRGPFTVMQITRLKEALEALPPTTEALHHVATATKMWRRITGRQISSSERFKADTVVRTMLQVPNPEAYIEHLYSRGLYDLALMFHPNTLESRKKDAALRGVFGGGSEYARRTAVQLAAQIVKE